MVYKVSEMAKKLSVAPSTLRYYDKEGLLPFVERSESGIRVFKDSDYEWLKVIECLKKTGMKLSDIKIFIEMAMLGDETVEQRLEIITNQKIQVETKIEELKETLKVLEFKQWYYQTAKQYGTTDVPANIPLSQLPERFREVKLNLKGNG